MEIQEVEVRAWAALADGKKEEALRQMKLAAEKEDGTEKSAAQGTCPRRCAAHRQESTGEMHGDVPNRAGEKGSASGPMLWRRSKFNGLNHARAENGLAH